MYSNTSINMQSKASDVEGLRQLLQPAKEIDPRVTIKGRYRRSKH